MNAETGPKTIVSGARVANLLSLLGIILMAGAVLYGLYRFGEIDKLIAAKTKDLSELEGQVKRLQEKVEWIRDGPLDELITPKAVAVLREGLRDPQGRQLYNYVVWLDLPYARKSDIREVRYRFTDRSFLKPEHSSSEPSSGFLTGYLGWGAMTSVPITVVPVQGKELTIDFPMAKVVEYVDKRGP